MVRYVVSLAILASGLIWLSVGAPVLGGPDLLRSQSVERGPEGLENCDLSPAECVALFNERQDAERVTPPPPDPRIEQVFAEDTTMKAIIGDRQLGVDYWLQVEQFPNPPHGDEGGSVVVVFAEPVFYVGEVPTASDPCEAVAEEGYVESGQPCLDEPREYGSRHVAYEGVTEVHAKVDTRLGRVVRIRAFQTPPDILEDTIEAFQDTP